MIREFAVDPGAVDTKACLKTILALFTREQGRIISQFPSKWASRVRYVLETSLRERGEWTFETQQWLTDRLGRSKAYLADTGREFDVAVGDWFENAIHEDALEAFRAIVTEEKRNGPGHLLPFSELDAYAPLLVSDDPNPMPREAEQFARSLGPLLRMSTFLSIIDPYFGFDDDRFLATLRELLARASEGRRSLESLEIHLRKTSEGFTTGNFAGLCESKLQPVIPRSVTARVFRWQQRVNGGKRLHDRFIVTDIGGVCMPGEPTKDKLVRTLASTGFRCRTGLRCGRTSEQGVSRSSRRTSGGPTCPLGCLSAAGALP